MQAKEQLVNEALTLGCTLFMPQAESVGHLLGTKIQCQMEGALMIFELHRLLNVFIHLQTWC
eukprot:1157334-Pelagomonas_calceolata.AAC.7